MDVQDITDFGTWLRRRRHAAGLTQEELAERAQVSARGISDLERGARSSPRKDTLQLLADALQLSGEERATFETLARAGRTLAREHGTVDGLLDGSPARTAASYGTIRGGSPGFRAPRRWWSSKVAAGVVAAGSIIVVLVTGLIHVIHAADQGTSVASPQRTLALWGTIRSSHPRTFLHLVNPLRVAVDRNGDIYVPEGNVAYSQIPPPLPARVLKLAPSGRPVARWGRYGRHPGEFNSPAGVTVDPQGNVYVADYGNNRIQKLSSSGRPLAVWGSYGTGPGQFDLPGGVALDEQGNIYVADSENNRIQKLSPAGKPLAVWGGTCGSQPGQFCLPSDVAVGPSGDVYVADFGNTRLQVLSQSGRPLAAWNIPGSDPHLVCPVALLVDGHGHVFYTNHEYNLVHELSAQGEELASWQVGAGPVTGLAFDPAGNIVAVSGDRLYRIRVGDRSGISLSISPAVPARFEHPSVVTTDSRGNVYVLTGSSNNYLEKLSPAGRVLSRWGPTTFGTARSYDLVGVAVDTAGNVYVSDVFNGKILKLSPDGRLLTRWGSEGQGLGQFDLPYGLAVDRHRTIYVADTGNDRIQKLSPAGKPLGEWRLAQPASGDAPAAVALDTQGNAYVADTANRRVEKLSPSGKPLAVFGSGQFQDLRSVAVDQQGHVYTVDARIDQVTELSPSGTVVARWGTSGAHRGQLRDPQGIAVDQQGNVFVADTGNNRLQRLPRIGTH